MSGDEQQIRDLVAQWLTATRQGDMTKVLTLMTDDVVFLVAGQQPFGKEVFAAAARAQATRRRCCARRAASGASPAMPIYSRRSKNRQETLMQYRGSCHCGKVRFSFAGTFEQAISCNCSICARRGSLLWFAPRDSVQVTGEEELATYTFNKHVIRHRFCKTCGILPFGEGTDPKGNATIAINIRCLEDFDFTQVPLIHYDGRSM